MTTRQKNKIIEQICKGIPLYIKDTGIQVSVEYYGTDMHEFKRGHKDNFCQVEVIGVPNNKALKLFEAYHIKRNSHSKQMELNGTINLKHLSLVPYETLAAKVLYEKKKTNK